MFISVAYAMAQQGERRCPGVYCLCTTHSHFRYLLFSPAAATAKESERAEGISYQP